MKLIRKLLDIEAIKINTDELYTFSSGIKSPIYCDNRKILSYPDVRNYVKVELVKLFLENFKDAEVIAGVATSGIPFGLMVADVLNIPFIYVRDKKKAYGLGNQIEGVLKENQKVVVIEDLITTGKSSLNVVNALREEGANVIGMCAIFTYSFKETFKTFEDMNVKLFTLTNFYSILNVCEDNKIKNLLTWHNGL